MQDSTVDKLQHTAGASAAGGLIMFEPVEGNFLVEYGLFAVSIAEWIQLTAHVYIIYLLIKMSYQFYKWVKNIINKQFKKVRTIKSVREDSINKMP